MATRSKCPSRSLRRRLLGMVAGAVVAVAPAISVAAAETGALVLQYPIGVRSAAMSIAGVADRSDPDNIYFNPANVTAVDGIYTTESYQLIVPWFSNDVWFGHVSAGAGKTFDIGRPVLLALNVTSTKFSYGESIATDTSGNPLGRYESTETYFALTAGVEMPIGDRVEWAFGAAFKHAKMDYAPAEFTTETGSSEATSGMADVGTVVSTTLDASGWRVHPALGLAAVNLGPDLEFKDREQKDPLPSWFNYGAAVRVDGPVVPLGSTEVPAVSSTIALSGNHGLNEQEPQWGFGYEVAFMEIASVRWGRRIDDHDRSAIDAWGVGLGIPAGPVRARFDYASVTYSHLGSIYGAPIYSYAATTNDVFGVSVAWLFDGMD